MVKLMFCLFLLYFFYVIIFISLFLRVKKIYIFFSFWRRGGGEIGPLNLPFALLVLNNFHGDNVESSLLLLLLFLLKYLYECV